MSLAIVTTATTSTFSQALALRESVRRWVPDVEVTIVASQQLARQIERVQPDAPLPSSGYSPLRGEKPDDGFVDVGELRETPFPLGGILSESDQVALALPWVLRSRLTTFDVCVAIAPGHLVVRSPGELAATARSVGTAFAATVLVAQPNSHTPRIAALERFPADGGVDVVAVTSESRGFLDEWQAVMSEAVVAVDQGPLTTIGHQFLASARGRHDVHTEGESTLMHWSDFAGVEVGRLDGPSAAILECTSLFDFAARGADTDDPEKAWSLLVFRVPDARPAERFIELIASIGEPTVDEETLFDRLSAEIRRAADPYGRRWPAGDGAAFRDWLFATNRAGCTRIADFVVRSDPNLLRRFPDARMRPAKLRQWVVDGGHTTLGFDPFDPKMAPRTAEPMAVIPRNRVVHGLQWRMTELAKLVPGHRHRVFDRETEEHLGPDPRKTRGLAPPRRVVVQRTPALWGTSPRALNLVAPFRSESGLGEASRASLAAVRLLGLPFNQIDITDKYPSRNAVQVGLGTDSYGQFGDVNLIHGNADEMVTMGPGIYRHRLGGRFNAAMWFWEAADLRHRSRAAFHLVDELWVASEYLADIFGQYGRVPVHVVGLAADLPAAPPAIDRSRFGWNDDDLVFLFVTDALSSFARKNPITAIRAFISAFGPDFEGVRFLLKITNLNKFPATQGEIARLINDVPAITVLDDYLDRSEVATLMAAADVYVSLHAAEGYGLTLLEAMAVGTPVLCTGYSGNMDFTNAANSWLVDYDLITIDEPAGPYPQGSMWAAPRVDHAVELLRRIRDDRSAIDIKAALARDAALVAGSLERYAQRLGERLKTVM